MDWVSFVAYAAPFAVLVTAVVFCVFQLARVAMALNELARVARGAIQSMTDAGYIDPPDDDADDDAVIEQRVVCECGMKFDDMAAYSLHEGVSGHRTFQLVDADG